MMGLKKVTNEAGESELVEREGAQPREVDWSQVARVSCLDCHEVKSVLFVLLAHNEHGEHGLELSGQELLCRASGCRLLL
eukprot:1158800-Pelagomonas_calceolata.AAC.9